MEWVLAAIIAALIVVIFVLFKDRAKVEHEFFSQMHRDLDAIEKREDIIIREIQEFKHEVEKNSEACRLSSQRIDVFAKQLDKAFEHHENEVRDLLDRLQAKSLAEYAQLQRLTMSPEDIAKAKVLAEEMKQKREEADAAFQQRKRLNRDQIETVT